MYTFTINTNPVDAGLCVCMSGLVWEAATARCVMNCDKSADPNAVGLASGKVL